jgi:SAM-dependent methyltransferase
VPAVTTRTDYALALSEEEAGRYRLMAEMAVAQEAEDWAAAGIAAGAAVADVGCGPGAILAVLAERVGPSGPAMGVDRDPGAVHLAERAVLGFPQASAHVGDADDTGLPRGAFDVVMCRHVLAHNGGREQRIVDHLADLARPGGAVYLVDVDMTGFQFMPADPALDIHEYYLRFHALRGNDLSVGLRLPDLLAAAGLDVERHRSVTTVVRWPAGTRGPAWAAREAMVEDGVATYDDLARWDAAFDRRNLDADAWMYVPVYVGIGRRPA